MKLNKYSYGYCKFMHEKEKIENIKSGKYQKYMKQENEEIKDFIKNILPLMSVKDLVGCIIMKDGICDNEGAKFTGLKYGEDEYEVVIKKIEKEQKQ